MSFIYLYCLNIDVVRIVYTWKSCAWLLCLNNAEHSCLNNPNLWNNKFPRIWNEPMKAINLWWIFKGYCTINFFWPFSTFTLRDLSNDIKNTLRQCVLTLAIKLWVFGSLGELPSPHFGSVIGSVSVILTLLQSGVATQRVFHPLLWSIGLYPNLLHKLLISGKLTSCQLFLFQKINK
jgi:hypothetical protein